MKTDSKRFAALVSGLTSRDKEEKLWSITAVGILKIPEHADMLVDLLGSPDENVVEAALESLGRIGNPKSVKYILEFLQGEKVNFAEKALSVISSFDLKPILDIILKVAGPERPPTQRRKILSLLVGIEDPRVATLMGEVISQTQDPGLLTEALGYFIRFSAPEHKTIFKTLSNSGQWEVSMAANLALSRIHEESAKGHLKRLVKSPAHPIRYALVCGMNKAPMIEDREIYEILFKDQHPQIRFLSLGGIHLCTGTERQTILLDWLSREKDEGIRLELLKIAVKEKNPRFVDEFLRLMADSSEAMKKLGRDGISALGTTVVERVFIDFQKFSLPVKEQIILVLGMIGGDKALKVLPGFLESKERWIKLNAIDTIAQMGERKYSSRFVEMLPKEEDVWVQATLLSALSRIGEPSHLTVFAESLKHSDARVRANALEGFIKIKDPSRKELIEPLLHDPNDRVRVNAAIALWEINDQTVISSLEKMTREKTKWIKASAAFALGEIGSPEGTQMLIELLADNEDVVYKNALEALAKIGDPRGLVPILKERSKKRLSEEYFVRILNQFSENLRKN